MVFDPRHVPATIYSSSSVKLLWIHYNLLLWSCRIELGVITSKSLPQGKVKSFQYQLYSNVATLTSTILISLLLPTQRKKKYCIVQTVAGENFDESIISELNIGKFKLLTFN